MRILLVEDDSYMRQALNLTLTRQNYTVEVAQDGEMAWDLIQANTYDLVVLDVMLPKIDGISLCQKLRAAQNYIPILLLTGLNSGSDKVMGLDAGADDYVVKPFDVGELLARVRVLLRRSPTPMVMRLQWEHLQLEPASCVVTYQEQPLHLTPKEYKLLEVFLRNPSRVFSREDLLSYLWTSDESPGEATVTTHITGLRHKLKAVGCPADVIETVYGLGYRLKALNPAVN
ncbi:MULTISPECIES: response regulator transcription factor [unclassified Leptolyngbya]|uniref:response regulator transcription factor n=1 Tax=unclassified Leptolyngbya TaxID=2650499 RepID=UPI0016885BC6|nr:MULTISPECIES: response regulator transcription factor [unclassified Leptolyngbya]MBD1910792.1 response regulator transcription factor [Leptolyngbya sp. FACHB-8]MBD2158141.1 response regulator transcription factor [Leptolyngbya sp. FACHB-16]